MGRSALSHLAVLFALTVSSCARKQAVVTPAPLPPKTTNRLPSKPTPTPPRVAAKPEPTKPAALGEILPPVSREQLLKDIDGNLDRAERNIATLRSRTPTPDETRDIARVEAFIRQARDARSTNDLAVARSLAERADLLSQDLVRTR